MATPRQTRKQSISCLFTTLLLLLATLFPAFSSGNVIADICADDPAADSSRVVPSWWRASSASAGTKTVTDQSIRSLPVWWLRVNPALATRPRDSAQESVDHFDVTVPSSAVAGVSFSTLIEAHAADNSLVGVTTTISLETNAGESIEPNSTEMISGTAQEDVTLTTAGVGKLVRAISGTITGETTITINPADVFRLELSPSNATVTAGDAQSYVATAFDQYDNEIGDVTPSTTFDIDAQAGGSWSGSEYTSERVGTWTVEGTYEGVTGTAALIVEPAELDHIIINSESDNGGAAFGNPVEVGTHTMDIYQTYSLWAGCYDQFDNFCGDVAANWGATGVLAEGALVPSAGISTTFTPAPILSGTGMITATYVPTDLVGSTGLFTVQAPRLIINKIDSFNDPVSRGDILSYILEYANVGNAPVPTVYVTETYDPRLEFAYASPPPDLGNDIWVRDGLAPGENGPLLLVGMRVNPTLEPGTVLTNLVTVGGPRLGQHSFTETTTVTSTTLLRPSLLVKIDNDQSSVKHGDRLTYDLFYHNGGTLAAHNTTITATPPYSQYVASIECYPASLCEVDAEKVIYDLGTVPANASGTVDLVITLADPLPAGAHIITASAVITTVTPGDPPDDNYDEDVDPITTRPDLIVAADYEEIKPWPGKRVTYTIEYSNKGRISVTGVVITATQPRYTAFEDGGSDPGWEPLGEGRYRYKLEELGPESGELLFVATLTSTHFTTAMTDFSATFWISDDGRSGEDANPVDNVFEAHMGVPNLVIEDIDVDEEVWKGEAGRLWAYVRNTGTGKACGLHGPGKCGYFPLDLFFDPETPPVSYPFEGYGNCFEYVRPIDPGARQTVEIVFVSDALPRDSGACRPTKFTDIWLKVDNWNPDDFPFPDEFGYVPEYDEFDNVYQHPRPFSVYLPVVSRDYDANPPRPHPVRSLFALVRVFRLQYNSVS